MLRMQSFKLFCYPDRFAQIIGEVKEECSIPLLTENKAPVQSEIPES